MVAAVGFYASYMHAWLCDEIGATLRHKAGLGGGTLRET